MNTRMLNARTLALAIGGSAALLTATAAAEPGFLQLDRQDAISRVGGDISYLIPDDSADGVTILRFDVHGQYILPGGFGFYSDFPITYASGDGGSGTGIGDLEVGGIFLPRMTNPNFQLVLHGGVTLPTASDDSIDDVVANVLGVGARMTDVVQITPGGFTLRLGASPIIRSGQLFGRLDGGVDINLGRTGDGTNDPIIRINIGGGFDFGSASISAELINVITTDSDASDQMLNALAVGFRAATGSLRPYGGVAFPLDGDDLSTTVAITGGIEGVIGAR